MCLLICWLYISVINQVSTTYRLHAGFPIAQTSGTVFSFKITQLNWGKVPTGTSPKAESLQNTVRMGEVSQRKGNGKIWKLEIEGHKKQIREE